MRSGAGPKKLHWGDRGEPYDEDDVGEVNDDDRGEPCDASDVHGSGVAAGVRGGVWRARHGPSPCPASGSRS